MDTAGPSSSPILAVLASPEVITAGTALLAALITWLRVTIKRQQHRLEERMTRLNAHVVRAADAAESASEGVHNNHDSNLRDDLDSKFGQVLDRLTRLAVSVDDLRESDRQFEARMSAWRRRSRASAMTRGLIGPTCTQRSSHCTIGLIGLRVMPIRYVRSPNDLHHSHDHRARRRA